MSKKLTSKFKRQYGMTLMEMQEKYGVSINYILILHYKGELKDFILQHDKMILEPVKQ